MYDYDLTQQQINNDREFFVAYGDMLYYNGYEEKLVELCLYIKEGLKEKPTHIKFPGHSEQEEWKGFSDENCDEPMRWLWSMLVCAFGNYGTSPRFGWLEPDYDGTSDETEEHYRERLLLCLEELLKETLPHHTICATGEEVYPETQMPNLREE